MLGLRHQLCSRVGQPVRRDSSLCETAIDFALEVPSIVFCAHSGHYQLLFY
jgi:hypothetical protein